MNMKVKNTSKRRCEGAATEESDESDVRICRWRTTAPIGRAKQTLLGSLRQAGRPLNHYSR